MSYWCDNPQEHRREGGRDFERRGRYGYDSQKYSDSWDDCSKYYREGFDEARREHDRRDEQREEEEAAHRRAEHRRREQRELERQQEEEYYEQQRQQAEQYPEQPPEEFFRFELMPLLGWSRKRRLKWCRQHNLKFNT